MNKKEAEMKKTKKVLDDQIGIKHFKNFFLSILLISIIIALFYFFQNPKITGFIIGNKDAFNLKIEIPESYEEVMAGENIWFTTKLLNLANK